MPPLDRAPPGMERSYRSQCEPMAISAQHKRKSELELPGPDSILWNALADWRILLCAGRSLLLQVAHPAVAAGVEHYSNFAADPWRRLTKTIELYFGGVIFGWPDGSEAAAARLRDIHRRIRGRDAAGHPYRALDANIFHWVHATMVDGTAVLMEHFGEPLRGEDLDRFYEEARRIGRLCGLRDREMPADWAGFRDYFDRMVSCELQDNRTVRAVLASLADPPRPPFLSVPHWLWRSGLWPPTKHLVMLCTIGLLPVPLRERLKVSWDPVSELELRFCAACVRRLMPLLPAPLRMHPYAYAAFRQARRAAAKGDCRPASEAVARASNP